MIDNLSEILIFLKYPLACLFLLFAALSYSWSFIFKTFNLKSYTNIQRAHENEIPRLGGLFIYLFLFIANVFYFFDNNLLFNINISVIPIILISFKEDLFHNTSPKIRLISMLMSCLIFFNMSSIQLPIIDIPFLGAVINFYPISIIFFTFSIMVIMNGMNLIDGVNGLFSFTAIIQLVLIILIALSKNDQLLVNISIIFLLPLIIFLLFNYPLGKLFIGDLGAYFYGFVNSILTIYLFGKYQDLQSWFAVVILFYPSFELLFSYIRKIKNQISPFDPDNYHLHSLINIKLTSLIGNTQLSNNITTIVLFIFWLNPLLFYIFFPVNFFSIMTNIVFSIMLYLLFYKFGLRSLR